MRLLKPILQAVLATKNHQRLFSQKAANSSQPFSEYPSAPIAVGGIQPPAPHFATPHVTTTTKPDMKKKSEQMKQIKGTINEIEQEEAVTCSPGPRR